MQLDSQRSHSPGIGKTKIKQPRNCLRCTCGMVPPEAPPRHATVPSSVVLWLNRRCVLNSRFLTSHAICAPSEGEHTALEPSAILFAPGGSHSNWPGSNQGCQNACKTLAVFDTTHGRGCQGFSGCQTKCWRVELRHFVILAADCL